MFYFLLMDIQTKLWIEDAAAALRQLASADGASQKDLSPELSMAAQRLLRSIPGDLNEYPNQDRSRNQMEFVLNSMS